MESTQKPCPLAECRKCASPLLQPVDVAGPIDGSSIVMRFCPECAHTDFVVAQHCDVDLWLWRDERIAAWMADAADVVAADLALTGSLRSAQSPRPR
jgi:hypothetical protein